MAYRVGQFRKGDFITEGTTNSFATAISYTTDVKDSKSPYDVNQTFKDACLISSFLLGNTYFLLFSIKKSYDTYGGMTGIAATGNENNFTFEIVLNNQTDEPVEEEQYIGQCEVEAAKTDTTEYSTFSFVFSPVKNYNNLIFRMKRIAFDALNSTPRNWLVKEENNVWSIDNTHLTDTSILQLKNLAENKNNPWLRFGYQSRPGNLIVVNKLPIQVGRSGIYELNNGMKIESFMIAASGGNENKNIDAFLLDYAYNTENSSSSNSNSNTNTNTNSSQTENSTLSNTENTLSNNNENEG